MSDSVYDNYTNYVHKICTDKNIRGFKSHPDYNYVLEHVLESQGRAYFDLLVQVFPIDVIRAFCVKNDSVGNPRCTMYDGLVVSPTSLRYLYHAHLILTHLKKSDTRTVVEIGGGYGGLYLAIDFLQSRYNVSIESYTIIDLPDPSMLQQYFLSSFSTTIPKHFLTSDNYGVEVGEPVFLVSCYCFSEIAKNHQEGYIRELIPKVTGGFIAWNHIPVYNFGFDGMDVQDEVPNTSYQNKYVYF